MLSYQKKIAVMRYDIFNAEDVLCSQAKMAVGFFYLKARKLNLPSDEWVSAIGCREK